MVSAIDLIESKSHCTVFTAFVASFASRTSERMTMNRWEA